MPENMSNIDNEPPSTLPQKTEGRSIYEPLSSGQIRLLRIRRTTDAASSIEADLHVYNIFESTNGKPIDRYHGLSWRWGPLVKTIPIRVNGVTVFIRETLYQFLDALIRHHSPNLTVWVDTLCINQANEVEKSAQVAMMGDIYRKAVSVFAWIGVAGPDIDFIYCSLKQARGDNDIDGSDKSLVSDGSQNGANAKSEADTLNLSALDESLEVLFNNPYWKRVWTLQERAVAAELFLVSSNGTMKWSELESLYGRLVQRYKAWTLEERAMAAELFLGSSNGTTKWPLLEDFYHQLFWRGGEDGAKAMRSRPLFELARFNTSGEKLLELMKGYNHLRCSNLRDKIYAMLAIAKEGKRVPVDYGASLAKVYFDVITLKDTKKIAWKRRGAFTDGLRLFSLLKITVDDLLPESLGSNYDDLIDYLGQPKGRQDEVCSWLIGSVITSVTVFDPATFLSRRSGISLDTDWTGVKRIFTMDYKHYIAKADILPGDQLFDLLGSQYRENKTNLSVVLRPNHLAMRHDFVCFAYDLETRNLVETGLNKDFRATDLNRLERFWQSGRVYSCTLTARESVSLNFGIVAVRVHFDRLALIIHAAIVRGYTLHGHRLLEDEEIYPREHRQKSCSCDNSVALRESRYKLIFDDKKDRVEFPMRVEGRYPKIVERATELGEDSFRWRGDLPPRTQSRSILFGWKDFDTLNELRSLAPCKYRYDCEELESLPELEDVQASNSLDNGVQSMKEHVT